MTPPHPPAPAPWPPTAVIDLPGIRAALPRVDAIAAMRDAFAAYSRGEANIPPVGELLLPGGECHIKYGVTTHSPCYVVKVASGFDDNARFGLPGGNGLVLLFDTQTGFPRAVLLDQGLLTDVRTAAAGALCASLLAPPDVRCIGLVGTGAQARLQADYLRAVTPCRRVRCWGRDTGRASALSADLAAMGYDASVEADISAVVRPSQLVVTTTRSHTPLIRRADLHPGLHITAVGSDTPHKQELDAAVLSGADTVVVDSRRQSRLRGEVFRGVEAGAFDHAGVREIGEVIADPARGRTGAGQVTIADLTGVAVQDLYLASAVYDAWLARAGA